MNDVFANTVYDKKDGIERSKSSRLIMKPIIQTPSRRTLNRSSVGSEDEVEYNNSSSSDVPKENTSQRYLSDNDNSTKRPMMNRCSSFTVDIEKRSSSRGRNDRSGDTGRQGQENCVRSSSERMLDRLLLSSNNDTGRSRDIDANSRTGYSLSSACTGRSNDTFGSQNNEDWDNSVTAISVTTVGSDLMMIVLPQTYKEPSASTSNNPQQMSNSNLQSLSSFSSSSNTQNGLSDDDEDEILSLNGKPPPLERSWSSNSSSSFSRQNSSRSHSPQKDQRRNSTSSNRSSSQSRSRKNSVTSHHNDGEGRTSRSNSVSSRHLHESCNTDGGSSRSNSTTSQKSRKSSKTSLTKQRSYESLQQVSPTKESIISGNAVQKTPTSMKRRPDELLTNSGTSVQRTYSLNRSAEITPSSLTLLHSPSKTPVSERSVRRTKSMESWNQEQREKHQLQQLQQEQRKLIDTTEKDKQNNHFKRRSAAKDTESNEKDKVIERSPSVQKQRTRSIDEHDTIVRKSPSGKKRLEQTHSERNEVLKSSIQDCEDNEERTSELANKDYCGKNEKSVSKTRHTISTEKAHPDKEVKSPSRQSHISVSISNDNISNLKRSRSKDDMLSKKKAADERNINASFEKSDSNKNSTTDASLNITTKDDGISKKMQPTSGKNHGIISQRNKNQDFLSPSKRRSLIDSTSIRKKDGDDAKPQPDPLSTEVYRNGENPSMGSDHLRQRGSNRGESRRSGSTRRIPKDEADNDKKKRHSTPDSSRDKNEAKPRSKDKDSALKATEKIRKNNKRAMNEDDPKASNQLKSSLHEKDDSKKERSQKGDPQTIKTMSVSPQKDKVENVATDSGISKVPKSPSNRQRSDSRGRSKGTISPIRKSVLDDEDRNIEVKIQQQKLQSQNLSKNHSDHKNNEKSKAISSDRKSRSNRRIDTEEVEAYRRSKKNRDPGQEVKRKQSPKVYNRSSNDLPTNELNKSPQRRRQDFDSEPALDPVIGPKPRSSSNRKGTSERNKGGAEDESEQVLDPVIAPKPRSSSNKKGTLERNGAEVVSDPVLDPVIGPKPRSSSNKKGTSERNKDGAEVESDPVLDPVIGPKPRSSSNKKGTTGTKNDATRELRNHTSPSRRSGSGQRDQQATKRQDKESDKYNNDLIALNNKTDDPKESAQEKVVADSDISSNPRSQLATKKFKSKRALTDNEKENQSQSKLKSSKSMQSLNEGKISVNVSPKRRHGLKPAELKIGEEKSELEKSQHKKWLNLVKALREPGIPQLEETEKEFCEVSSVMQQETPSLWSTITGKSKFDIDTPRKTPISVSRVVVPPESENVISKEIQPVLPSSTRDLTTKLRKEQLLLRHNQESPSITTVDMQNMTQEQRAWAGIDRVLNDGDEQTASICTRDVLSDSIIQALVKFHESASVLSSPTNDESKHDYVDVAQNKSGPKPIPNAVQSNSPSEFYQKFRNSRENNSDDGQVSLLPSLVDFDDAMTVTSSFSATSLLSYLTMNKNIVLQDDSKNDAKFPPLGDFLFHSLTAIMERQEKQTKAENDATREILLRELSAADPRIVLQLLELFSLNSTKPKNIGESKYLQQIESDVKAQLEKTEYDSGFVGVKRINENEKTQFDSQKIVGSSEILERRSGSNHADTVTKDDNKLQIDYDDDDDSVDHRIAFTIPLASAATRDMKSPELGGSMPSLTTLVTNDVLSTEQSTKHHSASDIQFTITDFKPFEIKPKEDLFVSNDVKGEKKALENNFAFDNEEIVPFPKNDPEERNKHHTSRNAVPVHHSKNDGAREKHSSSKKKRERKDKKEKPESYSKSPAKSPKAVQKSPKSHRRSPRSHKDVLNQSECLTSDFDIFRQPGSPSIKKKGMIDKLSFPMLMHSSKNSKDSFHASSRKDEIKRKQSYDTKKNFWSLKGLSGLPIFGRRAVSQPPSTSSVSYGIGSIQGRGDARFFPDEESVSEVEGSLLMSTSSYR